MKVFLSYSRSDSALALQLGEGLRGAGFHLSDAASVAAGEHREENVERVLREANAMVVLFTPRSVASPDLSFEVGYALGHTAFKGRLVPVLAGSPAEVDDLLEQIPWILKRFRMVQVEDVKAVESGVRQVAEILTRAA